MRIDREGPSRRTGGGRVKMPGAQLVLVEVSDVVELSHDTKRIRLSFGSKKMILGRSHR